MMDQDASGFDIDGAIAELREAWLEAQALPVIVAHGDVHCHADDFDGLEGVLRMLIRELGRAPVPGLEADEQGRTVSYVLDFDPVFE